MLNGKDQYIRLMYLNFQKRFHLEKKELITEIEEDFYITVPLSIPKELEYDDICIILSYLFEYTCDPTSIRAVDEVMHELNKMGFEYAKGVAPTWMRRTIKEEKLGKDEHWLCKPIPNCLDIFLLPNRDLIFNKTKLYKRFKDWYIQDVNALDYQRSINKIISKTKRTH